MMIADCGFLIAGCCLNPQSEICNPKSLRLAMLLVLVAARAILHQFQAGLGVLAVFLSRVGPFLALGAGQGHNQTICFLRSSHLILNRLTRQALPEAPGT
jgi:hypothetical protein